MPLGRLQFFFFSAEHSNKSWSEVANHLLGSTTYGGERALTCNYLGPFIISTHISCAINVGMAMWQWQTSLPLPQKKHTMHWCKEAIRSKLNKCGMKIKQRSVNKVGKLNCFLLLQSQLRQKVKSRISYRVQSVVCPWYPAPQHA